MKKLTREQIYFSFYRQEKEYTAEEWMLEKFMKVSEAIETLSNIYNQLSLSFEDKNPIVNKILKDIEDKIKELKGVNS